MRGSNYIWVINNFIAHLGATYIRGFTVDMLGRGDSDMFVCNHHKTVNTMSQMSELTNPVYRIPDIHAVITLWYYAVTYGSSLFIPSNL